MRLPWSKPARRFRVLYYSPHRRFEYDELVLAPSVRMTREAAENYFNIFDDAVILVEEVKRKLKRVPRTIQTEDRANLAGEGDIP